MYRVGWRNVFLGIWNRRWIKKFPFNSDYNNRFGASDSDNSNVTETNNAPTSMTSMTSQRRQQNTSSRFLQGRFRYCNVLSTYQSIASICRQGGVWDVPSWNLQPNPHILYIILQCSPVKRPSVKWPCRLIGQFSQISNDQYTSK